MKVPLKEEIYELEELCSKKFGMPKLLLMENAGASAARFISEKYPGSADKKFLVICGTGNNGGDGAVIARKLYLQKNKGSVRVVILSGRKKSLSERTEASVNFGILERYGIPVHFAQNKKELNWIANEISRCDIIVDAIFGIGFRAGKKTRTAGFTDSVIEKVNRSGKKVVSVDLPSGVFADGGADHPVQADDTVSFAFPKLGTLDYPGREFAGNVKVVPIDLPSEIVQAAKVKREWITPDFAKNLHRERKADSYKGSYGHLLVIGGNSGNETGPAMSGAVILAGMAALKSGVGLLTVAVPEKVASVVQKDLPESMTVGLPDDVSKAIERLDGLVRSKKISSILIGNGFGKGKFQEEMVSWTLKAKGVRKIVIDADALNCISGSERLKKELRKSSKGGKSIVITPHIGEMARLTGKKNDEVKNDKWNVAPGFSKSFGVVTVLKDAVSCIASPEGRTLINDTGSPALAKGGSGDILAGIIAGLLTSGYDASASGALGAYMLGKAGEMFGRTGGTESALSRDILKNLPACFKELSD